MRTAIIATALLVLLTASASAQALPYDASWWTVDGGGAYSTTGIYTLGATAGQPDAAALTTTGNYAVSWGYWPAISTWTNDNHPVAQTQRIITFGDLFRLLCVAMLAVTQLIRAGGARWAVN
jgi:hypothetical protein